MFQNCIDFGGINFHNFSNLMSLLGNVYRIQVKMVIIDLFLSFRSHSLGNERPPTF